MSTEDCKIAERAAYIMEHGHIVRYELNRSNNGYARIEVEHVSGIVSWYTVEVSELDGKMELFSSLLKGRGY